MGLSVLDRAVKKIRHLPYPELRKPYARALKDSLRVDHDTTPPRPSSPKDLASEYGLTVEILEDFFICLDRENAVLFLQSIGIEISTATFNKRYTSGAYKQLFRRELSANGTRHLFTYAEVLHLVGNLQRIPFPRELEGVA